jgi:plasmid maintenance system killer protein
LEIEILNKNIEDLFANGSSKKLKLNKNVIQDFFEVMAILSSAEDIYDLWSQPSLKFEKL